MTIYRGPGGTGSATSDADTTLYQDFLNQTLAARDAALQAEVNAELAETNAETAETNAETAATNAANNASSASSSASAAANSASNASSSASAAASSASSAATSATNAANSATAAASSAASAANSASTATTQASNASSSATAAASSASSAATSATNAASSASSASTSAINAANSATSASNSASSAAMSATNAANSATSASNSATAAATSASEAAGYAASINPADLVHISGTETITGAKTFSSNPIVSSGVANGVCYLNGSKVLTTGSALTFDGSVFGIAGGTNGFKFGTASNFGIISLNGSVTTSASMGIFGGATGDADLYYQNATGGGHRFRVGTTTMALLDSSGNLGLGVTPSAWGVRGLIDFQSNGFVGSSASLYSNSVVFGQNAYYNAGWKYKSTSQASYYLQGSGSHQWFTAPSGTAGNAISFTQAMTLDASGNLLVGRTNTSFGGTSSGVVVFPAQGITIDKTASTNLGSGLYINRSTVGDGNLVEFAEGGTLEGTISVSGTTVSYNGGHLARFAQTNGPKDDTLVKGTVLSNLDEMNQYVDVDGNPVANEQLNKVKVSDVEGDVNVAGVFVNWSYDGQHNVDEINMAMTGDMIIRIAPGVAVQRGDLLMSAGDGTAKPQGDDIVRSKTVAKVTSIHVTCTYEDGSYCVPCVLMAC